ncbi:MAG: hypothetical protein IPN34_21040 [Planctomycetes bacterium]|nr:hypothetical protein [Planctomycetota bacterium]
MPAMQDEPTQFRMVEQAGLKIVKTFDMTSVVSERASSTIIGHKRVAESPTLPISSSTHVVMVDETELAKEDRSLAFKRTYPELICESVARGSGAQRIASALSGEQFRFARDEINVPWRCAAVSAHIQQSAVNLTALKADADFLGLLPISPVVIGAEWKPDIEIVNSFFRPGGDLGFLSLDSSRGLVGEDSHLVVGSVVARFVGTKMVLGQRIGVISFEAVGERFITAGYEFDSRQNMVTGSVSFKGAGWIEWNLLANRPHAIQYIESATEVITTIAMEWNGRPLACRIASSESSSVLSGAWSPSK